MQGRDGSLTSRRGRRNADELADFSTSPRLALFRSSRRRHRLDLSSSLVPWSYLLQTAMAKNASHYVDVSNLEWQSSDFPGVHTKMLWRDEASGAFTALFRLDPGATLPLHRHTGIEQTFVLEGSLVDGDGVCTAGNFVWRARDSVHTAHSPDGCLAIGIFQRPNEFFDNETPTEKKGPPS